MAVTTDIDPRRYHCTNNPYRPHYHFLPPINWMNDPNGAIYWKGRYHLFYQHNPLEPKWGAPHWGHTVSDDLVHWSDLPLALVPQANGPDPHGCYSGGAFMWQGKPALIYHGFNRQRELAGNCIALPLDDDLIRWQKHPANPVIFPEGPDRTYRVFDPCAWAEGDMIYALSGRISMRGEGDAAFLFRSKDLEHWEFMHEFYDNGMESDCAVPDFFPLGDRHMLLFASHKRGPQYYLGDYVNHRLVNYTHGRMADVAIMRGNLGAAITLEDDQGRRILFAWINEGVSEEAQLSSGLAGILSLPRVLSIGDDGTLRIEPVPELEMLRTNHRTWDDIGGSMWLSDFAGSCIEIDATFDANNAADSYGLAVCTSPDRQEETTILYDPLQHRVLIDPSRSSLSEDVSCSEIESAPLVLREGEPLRLRVYVDRSVVEVFANGRQSVTKRIYPTRHDSVGLATVAYGGSAQLRHLDLWSMDPIWPT